MSQATPYDPNDPNTWSNEQQEMDLAMWFGLIEGDRDPLIAYLRSDFPISRRHRQWLIECLEGSETLHRIEFVKRRTGPGGVVDQMEKEAGKIAIVEFVEQRLGEGSSVKAAVIDASLHFKVSPTTIRSARSWSKAVKEGRISRLEFSMTGWSDNDCA